MRAERLLKLILILADGRRRTAARLGEQLDVSERTIYRDLDALTALGAPIRATRGPDGGVELEPGVRLPTVPLSAAEIAGLAALTVPSALGSLAEPLRHGLNKVLAGLGAAQQAHADAARQRLLVVSSPWWTRGPGAELGQVLDAVWRDRRVRLTYRDGAGRASTRDGNALAVFVQGERWYLLADTPGGQRMFRGDRITAFEVLAEGFQRPELDLVAVWDQQVRAFVGSRPAFPVTLDLTPAGLDRLRAARPPGELDGVIPGAVEIDFQREDLALAQIVALGSEVRVLGPPALRDRLAALVSGWLA